VKGTGRGERSMSTVDVSYGIALWGSGRIFTADLQMRVGENSDAHTTKSILLGSILFAQCYSVQFIEDTIYMQPIMRLA
jgi:hypothetical protein